MKSLLTLSLIACSALVASNVAAADVATDGLILQLDAAAQSKAGSSAQEAWKNLAAGPGALGDAKLHHFDGQQASDQSGWVGNGTPADPYALRFNGRTSYAEGRGNLELPELTLEVWASLEAAANHESKGVNRRGATLLGNDFGLGGVSLLIQPEPGSPLLLHGKTFTPVAAETPRWAWQQVVVVLKADKARLYVNGELSASLPAPRGLQKDHIDGYLLGAARSPSNDFVEADGLVGRLAIVRAYKRALTSQELAANFEADRGRFGLQASESAEPVTAKPLPALPGLPEAPLAAHGKWDYYYNPPRISGTGPTGWPSNARQAFDGYPSRLDQPYLRNCWRCDVKPDTPAEVTINYRRPVAVTRYVHFFIEPAAWRSAEIHASTDGENWQLLQRFDDLPREYPQVLPIDKPVLARFYKIVVHSLAPEAGTSLITQELETHYGATIGRVVEGGEVIQSEPTAIRVRVVNGDSKLEAATLRLIVPQDSAAVQQAEITVPNTGAGESAEAVFNLTPLNTGPAPMRIELTVNDKPIDQRTFTLQVAPKLAFKSMVPEGATIVHEGAGATVKGIVVNNGKRPAKAVTVTWPASTSGPQVAPVPVNLGDLAPGASAPFELKLPQVTGWSEGMLEVRSEDGGRTICRRPVASAQESGAGGKTATKAGDLEWKTDAGQIKMSIGAANQPAVTGSLQLLVNGRPVSIGKVSGPEASPFVAVVPGGLLTAHLSAGKTGDVELQCEVIPTDVNPAKPPYCDFEFRLSVDKPKIMFRPHIDWYTVEHGPNVPAMTNGHNSATRMLCIQTADDTTLSMVPDTDNMVWGFTKQNEMSIAFHIPLAPRDALGRTIWKPIGDSPTRFKIQLPVSKGDWWNAYRDVVTRIFGFEQPRQWAMPLTRMQMLTARYSMRAEVWSEKWQTVRSHPGVEFFYNFYGTTYNIPALYAWYLATDDTTALTKARKQVDWLLGLQEKDGPLAGAWFSMYCVEGSPPQLVGRDQAFNRWLLPHATGTSAKTLLWYWEASGKTDARVFAAATRACDWLLATQRPDGSWPYAFDLQGKPVSDLSGAGQIWCTWTLWKMFEYTSDTRYRDAAIRSKEAFERTFMQVHRYEGYWEDVSGAGGKLARSWEGYEPAIATLVFTEMGDKKLAIEAARDAATWTWTRVTSTRQYETAYGQTTEQSLCGPSQAQSPMVGIGMERVYQFTGDRLWSDFAGAMKAVNFCADPEQAYGMVATGGWDDPNTGVIGPPYENTRPMVSPNNSKGDEYGRQVWNNWMTDQFSWLALEWLVCEGNIRAPQYFNIDPNTLRGTVLGAPGRIKMPEERCDVTPFEHGDVNWVGYRNDGNYCLLVMNHKEKVSVAVNPHEAHLDVYSRAPRVLVGNGHNWKAVEPTRKGIQYVLEIPQDAGALFIWDRIK